jgi:hypothetical protein
LPIAFGAAIELAWVGGLGHLGRYGALAAQTTEEDRVTFLDTVRAQVLAAAITDVGCGISRVLVADPWRVVARLLANGLIRHRSPESTAFHYRLS